MRPAFQCHHPGHGRAPPTPHRHCGAMGDGVIYPSVFFVEGQGDRIPIVPPRRKPHTRQCSPGQLVLAALVSLALVGVAVEGYYLLRLQGVLGQVPAHAVSPGDGDRDGSGVGVPGAGVGSKGLSVSLAGEQGLCVCVNMVGGGR